MSPLTLRVPGGDGTELATDCYIPDQVPAPAVMTRTPYGRSHQRAEGLGWARRGFAFVVQDVRGRYDSPGSWRPYRGERADGAALAQWAVAQPWCDGRIIVVGASYGAYTAWATAVTAPELVRGVISLVPAMGFREVKFDPSGILRLAEHAAWWAEHGDSRTSRTGLAAAMFRAEPGLLCRLPVADIGAAMWPEVPEWWSAVAAGPDRAAPEAITIEELTTLDRPTLHLGGWYDLLVPQTIEHWRATGGALLVGPWEHQMSGTQTGVRDHGDAARESLGAIQVDWIHQVCAGRWPDWVRLFVTGLGDWLVGTAWPAATPMVLHAHPEGVLRAESPPEGRRTFVSDPVRPYPSRRPGADRAALSERTDAVRFRAPAPAPMTIVGEPLVTLHASTDAPTTDWVVRLQQRDSDGTVVSLASGSVVAGRDHSSVHEIKLTPIAAAIPAEATLELEVASADFPQLARNPQTGADRYTTTRVATATQSVHCGPSGTRIALPRLEQ